ncbi:MAG: NAD(P)/FAD-dependent oxidoreductase [Myxococcota bacterium]
MFETKEQRGDRKHVVIIGGGFGGLRSARALKRAPVDVTLIDRENHHLFQPLLYQVATAALAPQNITVPVRSMFRRRRDVRTLLGEVVGADLDARKVILENGQEISYDYLVVAAGAKTSYFGNDQWAEHAFGLKTVRDAIRIRERVLMMFEAAEREPDSERRRRLLTFVVIGGGPTGVETAGALSELGRRVLARDYRNICADDVRVICLEMADRVLLPFDEKLSHKAREQLEELNVEVRTGAKVTKVDEEGVHIGDELLPASVVCWAPGVQPVSLAEKLGVERERKGRIVVDACCAVPGHPEVFAIGDIAAFTPPGSETPLPQLAPVAMQQGRYVARTIKRDLRGKPREPFEYRDKGIMATIGRSRAVAESGVIKLSGMLAWLAWLFVHILYLINFQNRLRVMMEWFWAYVTFRPGARLITARYVPPPEQEPAGERVGPDPLKVALPGDGQGVEPAGTQPAARSVASAEAEAGASKPA